MGFHLFDQLVREPSAGQVRAGAGREVGGQRNGGRVHLLPAQRRQVPRRHAVQRRGRQVHLRPDGQPGHEVAGRVLPPIGPYDSSTVVDPYTVKVKFKSGYAPFLDSVAQPFLSIVSPTAAEKFGKDFGAQPGRDRAVQVRVVQDRQRGSGWSRTRTTPGRRPSTGTPAQPYLDAIVWRIINDPADPRRGAQGRRGPHDRGSAAPELRRDPGQQRLPDRRGRDGRIGLLDDDQRHQAAHRRRQGAPGDGVGDG